MNVRPDVGASSPAMQCISVDLPDPDGPITAVNRPRSNFDVDAVERPDGDVASSVGLLQPDGAGSRSGWFVIGMAHEHRVNLRRLGDQPGSGSLAR